jgi:hypothetical protein
MSSEAMAEASAMRAYRPMFSARAVVAPHHRKHLGSVYYWAFWLDAHSHGRYPQRDHFATVQRILTTLERVYTLHPVALGEVILRTSYLMAGEQMHLHWLMQNAEEAKKATRLEARFQPLMSALQDMAECLHPLLMAPLVAAWSLRERGVITNGLIDAQSGRATPTGLDAQPLCGKLMPIHLNRKEAKHIRNSAAHRRWRVLSAKEVEINDFDGAGRQTFGPRNFDHAQIVDFVEEWGIKLAASLAALCIFDINNHESLVTRCSVPLPTEPMREDIEQRMLETLIAPMGLDLRERVRQGADLELTVAIPKPRRATPEEFSWGGDGWMEKQAVTPQVVEVQLPEVMRKLVEQTLSVTISYNDVRIAVQGLDGSQLGTVVIPKADRVAVARREVDRLATTISLPGIAIPVVTMVAGPVRRVRSSKMPWEIA